MRAEKHGVARCHLSWPAGLKTRESDLAFALDVAHGRPDVREGPRQAL